MHTLTIKEVLAAPLNRVYQAWTDVDHMKRWFAPGDMRVPEAVADVQPGGRYRIVMERTDGHQHIVAGEYREVVPNERLSFSWQWEGSDAITFVELRFKVIDANTTELTLVHARFVTEDARDHHGQGWAGCLANLHRYIAAR
jgi:uncharacterized protein YndB with AHSA1/START domain